MTILIVALVTQGAGVVRFAYLSATDYELWSYYVSAGGTTCKICDEISDEIHARSAQGSAELSKRDRVDGRATSEEAKASAPADDLVERYFGKSATTGSTRSSDQAHEEVINAEAAERTRAEWYFGATDKAPQKRPPNDQQLTAKNYIERQRELVDSANFWRAMTVLNLCVLLCVLVMCFHWALDFVLDVLYYTGKPKHRETLVGGTAHIIVWFHEKAPEASIIVVGHSLGSVIAAHAVTSPRLPAECLRRTVLVTMGSPLNYVSRMFPAAVHTAQQLADTLRGRVVWINLWRSSDIIGKGLDLGSGAVQYCVGRGSHSNYWKDRKVWRAIVREALGRTEALVSKSDAAPLPRSLVERSLGALVVLAITVLGLSGAAIWAAALYAR
jgi:hypothetical protein